MLKSELTPMDRLTVTPMDRLCIYPPIYKERARALINTLHKTPFFTNFADISLSKRKRLIHKNKKIVLASQVRKAKR